ncbi:MAG: cupin domain-containing protein [Solirubrobacteraceae bacterium]
MGPLQAKRFESPDEVRPFKEGKGKVELVELSGDMVGHGTFEVRPGDVFHMPPGHDAWIVGDELCILLDFGGLRGYAKAS